MKASPLQSAFLLFLALSVTACRTGVASPNIGLDVSALPKVISISSKLIAAPQHSTAAADTVVASLPSMVE